MRWYSPPRTGLRLALILVPIFTLPGCGNDDAAGPEEPEPPGAVTGLQATTDVDSVVVTWAAATDAASLRVELRDGSTVLSQDLDAAATRAVFQSVPDATTFDVQVIAAGPGGETGSAVVQVTTNHFPWDEFYPTSLHFTRQGKATFYKAVPNGGFEVQTAVPYEQLEPACQGCHRPDQALGTKGCESCHDSATPALGAQVDASMSGVCTGCHSRIKYEMVDHGYSDYHRDVLGFECMDCHTMEDMHGDGTEYASMFDDGAIDAKCTNCHETVADNTYHSIHAATVDCAMCHMQSVVSCYNCHLEGALETPPAKRARRRIVDWVLAVNRNGKVSPANVATMNYGDETFAAIAPYFSHTIARDAVTSCADCHGNANVAALAADGVLKVGEYDPATNNIKALSGFVPIPFNYESALLFDFMDFDLDTQTWSLLEENGPDRFQMLYATPLTEAQFDKLK